MANDSPAAVIVDSTGANIAAVKGASTAAVAADKAVVVAVSPNNAVRLRDSVGDPLGSGDAFGRLRVSDPYTILDAKHTNAFTSVLYFNSLTSGAGASATYNAATSDMTLTSGTGVTGRCVYQTKRYVNYQPGKSQLLLMTFNLEGAQANCTKRLGYYDDNNGIYLELAASGAISLVRRSKTSGSVVNSAVAQGSWNIDPFDGTGPSGITLDLSKVQILVIDLQWLGVGAVRVGFSINGILYYAHKFVHANVLTTVFIVTPVLPMRYEILNTTTASSPTMRAICCTAMSEGGVQRTGHSSAAARTTGLSADSTARQVLGVRLKSGFRETVRLRSLTLITTTGATLFWELLLNPTVAGSPSFTSAATSSVVEYDVAGTTVTGGDRIDAGFAAGSGGVSVAQTIDTQELLSASVDGTTRDVIALVVTVVGGGGETVYGSIAWDEES